MNIKFAVMIGAFLLIGFMGNTAVNAYDTHTERSRAYEMQDRMMDMEPKVVEVDGQEVLYLPKISYTKHTIDVKFELYTLVDGELKQLKIKG
jgi:hypothetical protein